MAVASFHRGNWFDGTVVAVLAGLGLVALVRSWRRAILVLDSETITLRPAWGRLVEIPRQRVRRLVQVRPGRIVPVQLQDPHGHTLVTIEDPFTKDDLERVASYLGLEIE